MIPAANAMTVIFPARAMAAPVSQGPSCAPGGDSGQALDAVTMGRQQYIDLRQVPDETTVLSTAALTGRARLRLTFTIVGGGVSMLAFFGAWIWRATGFAPHAANVAAAESMVGCLIRAVARRCVRPR